MRERSIAVHTNEATLAATLALPDRAGPFPACLLLSGSGPLDRNSNVPGQCLDIARSLAAALAEVGVASLRYDKRGVGESTGDFLTTSFDDEVADAATAFDALRAQDDTTEYVAVVGHSVGATIAIRLARQPTPPDAFVLLAGAAQPGAHVMEWQTRRIGETRPVPARWFRSHFERQQAADRRALFGSSTPTVTIRDQTLPAAWFREYMAYDPRNDLPVISGPVFAITGRKDIQVDADDVATIGRLVDGPFHGVTPADLTHLLRSDAGPPGLSGYRRQLRRPPDPTLVNDIATWMMAQLR